MAQAQQSNFPFSNISFPLHPQQYMQHQQQQQLIQMPFPFPIYPAQMIPPFISIAPEIPPPAINHCPPPNTFMMPNPILLQNQLRAFSYMHQDLEDKSPSLSQFSSQPDQIKQEEVSSSSNSSKGAKEPIVLKQVCLSQAPSARSSQNSIGSNQSLDGLQQRINKLTLSINPQSDSEKNSLNKESPQMVSKNPNEIRKVLGGSQKNLFSFKQEQSKNSRKLSTHLQTKRSRFYYQSQDQE